MKFGLFGINTGPCSTPDTMKHVAIQAEAAGFESVWTGEHVVLPDPQAAPSPAPPLLPFVHPSTALSFIAGVTDTLLLGTGITLVAQRNPVVLAKEMASLDQLSKGRLLFGIGAGYLHQEFAALGIKFEDRGAKTDEAIDAMRELWTSENPVYAGQFVNFANIQSRPLAYQAGGPPIIVGGASAAAYRRAVTKGQGWYGFALDAATSIKSIKALKELSQTGLRPAHLGELEISITPRQPLTDELVREYEQMGVSRLIVMQTGRTEDQLLENIVTISRDYIN